MNEAAFHKTLLETLRYDDKQKHLKDILLPIINRSEINSIPKFAFTTRPCQHYEDIELRVPVPLINLANEHEDDINKLFRYVYQETDDYDLQDIYIKPRIIDAEEVYVENNVVFNEIQDTIVQGIRDAKFLIWVEVAWFSNDVFYKELLNRSEAGINVRVIVSDEDRNSEMIPKLKEHFETIVVPKSGFYNTNRMHNKFCIIDLEYVMHGSYNWSKSANYNGETLVTSVDRKLVKKFAAEFTETIVKNRQ